MGLREDTRMISRWSPALRALMMVERVLLGCDLTWSTRAVSKALVLLIQNKGGDSLKVGLISFSSDNKQEMIEIPKLQSKQVNMSLAVRQ